MKIFAVGEQRRIQELEQKFNFNIVTGDLNRETVSSLPEYDCIFDLNSDDHDQILADFCNPRIKLLVLCSVKKTLIEMVNGSTSKEISVAGMNLLPTFINRSLLEVSFAGVAGRKQFESFALSMRLNFQETADHAGMVTPRVIVMIINEACYSLYGRIASMEDIDKAMKLGTNYPYGPFEWCDRIGIKDVYETLQALNKNAVDNRYEICPLLKKKYDQRENFYS